MKSERKTKIKKDRKIISLAILFLLSYFAIIFIGSGYYFDSCSCSTKFFILKPKNTCARFCEGDIAYTNFQKLVNGIFFVPIY